MTAGSDIDITEERVLTQEDFDRFAHISGDDNPIHVDPAFSARTRFGRTVSHGMLLYSVFWGMLRRAGIIAPQVAQKLMFPNPAFAGEPIRFAIRQKAGPDRAVAFALKATRISDAAVVCEGEAVVAPAEIPA